MMYISTNKIRVKIQRLWRMFKIIISCRKGVIQRQSNMKIKRGLRNSKAKSKTKSRKKGFSRICLESALEWVVQYPRNKRAYSYVTIDIGLCCGLFSSCMSTRLFRKSFVSYRLSQMEEIVLITFMLKKLAVTSIISVGLKLFSIKVFFLNHL